MKTQILRLEPYDDVVSIRDKMNWAKTRRILLVWPARRLRLRRLDFILLRRHARHLGAQIALVTHDQAVRIEAHEAGVPVFASVEEAHSAPWRYDRRRRKRRRPRPPEQLAALREAARPALITWTQHPLVRTVVFTVAVLALLAIVAVLAPSAEVQLTPIVRSEGITIDVQAGPDISAVNLSGALPATWRTVEVEGRAEAPVTGETRSPSSPAHGEVVFTNLTTQAIVIPKGTLVLGGDPPVRFTTTRAAQVPAGAGEQITVPVQALDWGARGNLPADSLRTLTGDLGLKVAVTNPSPTRGGADTVVAAPAPLDHSRLYSQLRTDLEATALEELRATLEAGDILLEDSLEPVSVLQRTYDPPGEQPSETLRLTLRMTFRALVIRSDDLRTLAEGIRQTQLLAGYQPVPDTLRWVMSTPPVLEGEQAHGQLRINWQEIAVIDPAQVISGVSGRLLEEASSWLRETMPLAAPPRITLSPPWWPRLPLLPFRIHIVVMQ